MKPGEALYITSWEGLRARHGQGPSSMLLGCIPWVLFPDCLRRHKALNPPSLRGSDVEEESGAGLSRLRRFLAVMQCLLRTPSSSPIEFGSSEMKRPIPSAWAAVLSRPYPCAICSGEDSQEDRRNRKKDPGQQELRHSPCRCAVKQRFRAVSVLHGTVALVGQASFRAG